MAKAAKQRGTGDAGAPALLRRALEPVDIASLVFFRVAFGLLLIWQAWIYLGEVEAEIVAPAFHFTYLGFGWVKPLPGDGMVVLLYAMMGLGAFVAAGFLYRASAWLAWLANTYVFLIDQALYQNHYYLLLLVCFLMALIPAHRAGSVDAWWRGAGWRRSWAPAWCLWILRIQMGLVYFYAGVAKLNADWLHGYPVRHSILAVADWPIVGPHVTEPWLAIAVSWAGMLLDLFIFPALLWRRTRPLAFAAAVFFHATNKAWLGIGIFPGFSIALTAMFFEPDWPRRLLRLPRPSGEWPAPTFPLDLRRRVTIGVVAVFLAVQVLLPLRRFLYEGNVSWNEEGHRFAWLQKIRGKKGVLRFVAVDPYTGRTWDVNPHDHLTDRQHRLMAGRPYMILQYAHHVADVETKPGRPRVKVVVVALDSLNGREPQPLIDPGVDLASEPRRWITPYPWIEPLQVPLAAQWDLVSPPTHPVAVRLIERHRQRLHETVRTFQAQAANSGLGSS